MREVLFLARWFAMVIYQGLLTGPETVLPKTIMRRGYCLRVVPKAIIGDAPSGAKPDVQEISTVGCTIVFKPITSPVSLQDFLALHPAFSADF